jgi:hypothetical protein
MRYFIGTRCWCVDPKKLAGMPVMKISDDPDYPLQLSCFIPLGPTDEVHVLHPYKMKGFRKLRDFVLVPGTYRGVKRSEANINAELFSTTVRALKRDNPEFAFLIVDA